VRAFRTFSLLLAFSFVILMCSLKRSFGSKVRPSILGFLTVGMVVLLMDRLRVALNSAGSGVKRVDVDLSGFNKRLFSLVQVKMSWR